MDSNVLLILMNTNNSRREPTLSSFNPTPLNPFAPNFQSWSLFSSSVKPLVALFLCVPTMSSITHFCSSVKRKLLKLIEKINGGLYRWNLTLGSKRVAPCFCKAMVLRNRPFFCQRTSPGKRNYQLLFIEHLVFWRPYAPCKTPFFQNNIINRERACYMNV